MNQAQALFHLQTIDLETRKHRARLQEIVQLLGENERILAAQQALDNAEAALVPIRTQIRDLELNIKGVESKSKATEDRLYAGKVKSPKELQDMQDEIAALKRRRAELEDTLLETMIALEHGETTRAEAAANLDAVQTEQAAEHQNLISERAAIEQQLTTLQAQREAAVAEIEAENLTLYDSLSKSKGGRPVAQLVETSCRACGVGQTTTIIQQVRQGHSLVRCQSCGRILVLL